MKETDHAPENWVRCSLSDIVVLNPKNDASAEQMAGFVPMALAPTDYHGALQHEEKLWGEIKKSYTNFADDDVIFAKVTPCFENGKAAIVRDMPSGIGAGSSEFYVLRPASKEISPSLLFAIIKTHSFMQQGAENMTGAVGLRRVPRAFVGSFPIALPPLAEQKVIAEKLDTLLAQVENTKARLERIPQILKRFRQSVLAAAVSGRLTEEWRRGHSLESVSVAEIKRHHRDYALAKGRRYSEPSRFQDSNTVYQIPESWKWFRAEELCDLITKGTTPKKIDMSGDGHVPFIKVYNLTFDGTLDFSIEPTFISKQTHENALKRSKSYPGDVLMNIVGPPLGKVSIVPDTFPEWNLNQAISIFRPVTGVTSCYLALCLRDTALLTQTKNKAKATAGQFNLTLEICRDYAIPVPSLKEQTQIVCRVDQLFAHADRIEQQVQVALERVNYLTQSILAKAFRGELTEQWRKENPGLISGENSAEALLERIKAERAAMKPAKRTRKSKTSA